ncbi:MAG: DUF192 domain-containing protein [Patescibacteria group bacterium]
MFKSIFLPIIAVCAFIILVGLLNQGKLNRFIKTEDTNSTTDKMIVINDKEIKVEVAKTNEERAKGLSNRNSLDENSGMIFVFNINSKPSFWMKDTKVPLDIIWINDDKIVSINKNVEPEPNKKDSQLKKYPAPSEIDYVLEVNGGFSDKHGIKAGSTVQKLSDL